MDNKVLDEAVEVALSAAAALNDDAWPDDYDADDRRVAQETMRAALLASLPVLLGEPVAWQYRLRKGDHEWITAEGDLNADYGRDTWEVRRLYAPSLGEGDGR